MYVQKRSNTLSTIGDVIIMNNEIKINVRHWCNNLVENQTTDVWT